MNFQDHFLEQEQHKIAQVVEKVKLFRYTCDMKEITPKTIAEAVSKACRNLPVAFAYLYGSQATGLTHDESDVDIALGFVAGTPDHVERRIEATMAISASLPIRTELIDVQDFDALPLAVRFRVVRDGRLVYCADESRQRRQVLSTIARYHDQKPIIDRQNSEFFAQATRV